MITLLYKRQNIDAEPVMPIDDDASDGQHSSRGHPRRQRPARRCQRLLRPGGGAMLPKLVEQDDRVRANALRSLSAKASGLAGPALAGIVMTFTSGGVLVIADAISFIISAGLLLRARPDRGRRPETVSTGSDSSMV